MGAFRFKRFIVEQDDVAMKVGTDGVLLGAWVDVEGAGRILDIGTGTGVIALQMAQRNEDAQIDAIDIDEVAVARAASNFALSEWSERLNARCVAAQVLVEGDYDLIVSNPPYFIDSLLPPDARRSSARHTESLSFEELDEAVCRVLADGGRFALILPTNEFERYLALTNLHLVRRCSVHSVRGGAVKRVMAEFSRREEANIVEESITIELDRRGDYSDEYRALTKDFYLKF